MVHLPHTRTTRSFRHTRRGCLFMKVTRGVRYCALACHSKFYWFLGIVGAYQSSSQPKKKRSERERERWWDRHFQNRCHVRYSTFIARILLSHHQGEHQPSTLPLGVLLFYMYVVRDGHPSHTSSLPACFFVELKVDSWLRGSAIR